MILIRFLGLLSEDQTDRVRDLISCYTLLSERVSLQDAGIAAVSIQSEI